MEKSVFKVPSVCGCRARGKTLRRIVENTVMFRTEGEAGPGDVLKAMKHTSVVSKQMAMAKAVMAERGDKAFRTIALIIEVDANLLK